MFSRFSNRREAKKAVRICVSDPFDFRVEGANSVVCDFLEAIRGEKGERWIVRARSQIVAPKGKGGTLVIVSSRHKGEELVGVWSGREVSANFGLVPKDAEPCEPGEAVSKAILFGIGSVVAE
jgi:hypothetical protein